MLEDGRSGRGHRGRASSRLSAPARSSARSRALEWGAGYARSRVATVRRAAGCPSCGCSSPSRWCACSEAFPRLEREIGVRPTSASVSWSEAMSRASRACWAVWFRNREAPRGSSSHSPASTQPNGASGSRCSCTPTSRVGRRPRGSWHSRSSARRHSSLPCRVARGPASSRSVLVLGYLAQAAGMGATAAVLLADGPPVAAYACCRARGDRGDRDPARAGRPDACRSRARRRSSRPPTSSLAGSRASACSSPRLSRESCSAFAARASSSR